MSESLIGEYNNNDKNLMDLHYSYNIDYVTTDHKTIFLKKAAEEHLK